ncbi:MAG: type I restriction-modification system subunit M N-terminal domain-containing protein [Tetrasphaera sp.]
MKVADKLRGTFKQHEYGSVMLPLLVLRRMDAVLAPTKQAVLEAAAGMKDIGEGQAALLKKKAGHRFYNTSPLTFASLLGDDKNLADNLRTYIRKLSPEAYAVMEAYDFDPKARAPRPGRDPVCRRRGLRRPRPAPDCGQQRGDGLHLRGAAAEVLRDEQRDRR